MSRYLTRRVVWWCIALGLGLMLNQCSLHGWRGPYALAQTDETTTTVSTTTTEPPTTTTTQPTACQWEWGGQPEANPQPCHDSEDVPVWTFLGVGLLVFLMAAQLVASFGRR